MNGFGFFAGGVITIGVLCLGMALGAMVEENIRMTEEAEKEKLRLHSGRYPCGEDKPEDTTEEDS